ncbi:MAG: histidine kinase [Deltaproteobacteria bacterium]|nr:histidine kinase [Deltaproteobacteria bacterium]
MWKRLTLRARILLILAALVLTTLAGALVTMWHNEATDTLLTSLIDKNLASFQAAEELEAALLRQKGFLTYFFLDGNPDWLRQLAKYQESFEKWLQQAKTLAYTETMREILQEIEEHYRGYLESREQVIALYRRGAREEGARLHQEVRRQYAAISALCQRYKLIHEYTIARARSDSQVKARLINGLALAAIVGVAGLGVLLAYILVRQILSPIRRLASGAPMEGDQRFPDEVQALSRRVYTLMEDVDQAQSQLERSQETLVLSEKMALVGRLAAGVAHSIRNPLTSVKMRLYSLGRHLGFTPTQKEDFEVISEEIRHIDSIVRDFLEFSRPPKLKMQRVRLADVVESAYQLLRYRLELYGVQVSFDLQEGDQEVLADPEQLKEVLVNLLMNACEAMLNGGRITIRQEEVEVDNHGRAARLTVQDNGPGIPVSIQEKVFQPFFSTKEEGTGLGLSIARRIVVEHGGALTVQSREGEGTAFSITLPLTVRDSAKTT